MSNTHSFCSHVLPLLSELADGRLAPALEARVQTHLQSCPDCAAEWGALCRMGELTARVQSVSAPRELKYRILNCVARQEAAQRRSPLRALTRATERARMTIAIAFGLALGVWWNQRAGTSTPRMAPALAASTNPAGVPTEARIVAAIPNRPARRTAGSRPPAPQAPLVSPVDMNGRIQWSGERATLPASIAFEGAPEPSRVDEPRAEVRPTDEPMMMADMPKPMMMPVALDNGPTPATEGAEKTGETEATQSEVNAQGATSE